MNYLIIIIAWFVGFFWEKYLESIWFSFYGLDYLLIISTIILYYSIRYILKNAKLNNNHKYKEWQIRSFKNKNNINSTLIILKVDTDIIHIKVNKNEISDWIKHLPIGKSSLDKSVIQLTGSTSDNLDLEWYKIRSEDPDAGIFSITLEKIL